MNKIKLFYLGVRLPQQPEEARMAALQFSDERWGLAKCDWHRYPAVDAKRYPTMDELVKACYPNALQHRRLVEEMDGMTVGDGLKLSHLLRRALAAAELPVDKVRSTDMPLYTRDFDIVLDAKRLTIGKDAAIEKAKGIAKKMLPGHASFSVYAY